MTDPGALSFAELRLFCGQREIDVLMVPPQPPAVLALRGQFDGYGQFFTVAAEGVEYVDLGNGVTVGELILTDVHAAAAMSPKWRHLRAECTGSCLVIRSADYDDLRDADPLGLHVVVAKAFGFERGPDWGAAGGQ